MCVICVCTLVYVCIITDIFVYGCVCMSDRRSARNSKEAFQGMYVCAWYVYVCIYLYVCTENICVYVCVCVCISRYVCMRVVCVCMYVQSQIYVCMYVCMYVFVCVHV